MGWKQGVEPVACLRRATTLRAMDIPDLGSDLIGVAIRSAIVYVFLVLALRVGGKREVGQMSTPDLVVLLVVANGVQNAMVGTNTTLVGGVVACATILALAKVLQVLTTRSTFVADALIGEPRILIREGEVIKSALQAEDITHHELMAALREHGLESVDEVRLAVLEVDGSISVLPIDRDHPTTGGPGPRIAGHLARKPRRVGRRGRSAAD
jgi:uncharacterized membrane protein YcaP (DUF421 family)